METKALEIRDSMTFFAVLAVDMNPNWRIGEDFHVERYLLRRCGFACDDRPMILVTRLEGHGQATWDPYRWDIASRTMHVAHKYIVENWHKLKNGDVVDVQFILGETPEPKISERIAPYG